jgi:predicted aldo/keto reductase-like oxidoreductase
MNTVFNKIGANKNAVLVSVPSTMGCGVMRIDIATKDTNEMTELEGTIDIAVEVGNA